VDLLNRVFSAHLIDLLLNATKQERKSALKKLRYCVSQGAQGSVFCMWTKLHRSRWRRSSTLGCYSRVTEVGTKGLIHGLEKLTQFCSSAWSLLLRGDETGAFKHRKAFSFSIGLVPILTCGNESGDDWKNIDIRTDGKDRIFAKSPRYDTSWKAAQVRNPWSPQCQATFSNREIPVVLVRPCISRMSWARMPN